MIGSSRLRALEVSHPTSHHEGAPTLLRLTHRQHPRTLRGRRVADGNNTPCGTLRASTAELGLSVVTGRAQVSGQAALHDGLSRNTFTASVRSASNWAYTLSASSLHPGIHAHVKVAVFIVLSFSDEYMTSIIRSTTSVSQMHGHGLNQSAR